MAATATLLMQSDLPENDGKVWRCSRYYWIRLDSISDDPTTATGIPAIRTQHPKNSNAFCNRVGLTDQLNPFDYLAVAYFATDDWMVFNETKPKVSEFNRPWGLDFTFDWQTAPSFIKKKSSYKTGAGAYATKEDWVRDDLRLPSGKVMITRKVQVAAFTLTETMSILSQKGKWHALGSSGMYGLFLGVGSYQVGKTNWSLTYSWLFDAGQNAPDQAEAATRALPPTRAPWQYYSMTFPDPDANGNQGKPTITVPGKVYGAGDIGSAAGLPGNPLGT